MVLFVRGNFFRNYLVELNMEVNYSQALLAGTLERQ